MKEKKRIPAGYPGVYYRFGVRPADRRIPIKEGEERKKEDKVYYILYRKDGKKIEEKAGAASRRMTPAKASAIRVQRIEGAASNRERRERGQAKKAAGLAAKEAEESRWTFNRLWDHWKELNEDLPGLYRDDTRYGKHLRGPFGEREPKDLVRMDIHRLKAKMQKRPYADDTILSTIQLLFRVANHGPLKDLCPGLSFRIPIKELKLSRKDRTETLTEEQMARYAKTCKEWKDPQEGNFQHLILLTGMRRGEVMNLRWDDVDLGRGFLKLRDPKGKRDQYVPLSDEALELLKNHPRENEYVFTQEYGSPRSKSRVALSSSAIKRAAGLPDDFRPNHGLRHSFASALADSGEVTLQQLMALLTHKTPSMTMRYSHLSDQALKRSANVMSRIVKNAEESNGEGNIA